MAKKDLKDKAIKIKGKSYVLVSDRVIYFNETYPNGSIETDYVLENDTYHFKAIVTPDVSVSRRFTGHSQATIGDGMVNKSAAMENAETSAVGRALGMLGIGVLESIASADEVNKAVGSSGIRKATEKQLEWLRSVASRQYNTEDPDDAIEQVVGKPVTEINIKEVKSVVDKITSDYEPTKQSVTVDGKEIDVY